MFGGSKTCIVCNEESKDEEKFVEYELRTKDSKIGKFSVHKKLDCFVKGSVILINQIQGSTLHDHTVVTNHIDDEKYIFKMIRNKKKLNFGLVSTLPNGRLKPDGEMFKFFRKYIYEQHVIFVFQKKLLNAPEWYVPLLVSRKDPIIPTGMLQDAGIIERFKNGEVEFNTSMRIRGENDIEAMSIMSNYVIAMSLSID